MAQKEGAERCVFRVPPHPVVTDSSVPLVLFSSPHPSCLGVPPVKFPLLDEGNPDGPLGAFHRVRVSE